MIRIYYKSKHISYYHTIVKKKKKSYYHTKENISIKKNIHNMNKCS